MPNFDKLQAWMKKTNIFDKDIFNELKKFEIEDPDYDFVKISKKEFEKWYKKMQKQINVEYSKNLKKKTNVNAKLNGIKKQWKKTSGKHKKNAIKIIPKTEDEMPTNNNDNNNGNISPKKAKKISKKNSIKNIKNENKNIKKFNGLKPYITRLIVENWFRKLVNKKIEKKIFVLISKYSPIFSSGNQGHLIVKKNKTYVLKSGISHNFESITLEEGSTLTVEEYTTRSKKQDPTNLDGTGGELILKCATDIILHPKSKITVRGLGYKGGHGRGLVKDFGQGPGGGEAGWGTSAKGGLYGNKYGDNKLTKLYLGSGGGAYNGSGNTIRPGGNGGGILNIECIKLILKSNKIKNKNNKNNKFIYENGSKIIASGNNSVNGGGGSGGSIYIKCFELNIMNNCKIINIGGKGEGDPYSQGTENGGHGRIRIDMFDVLKDEKIKNKINCKYTYFGCFKK